MARRRPVIGVLKMVAMIAGWLLIVLAILGLPQMRFPTGSLEGTFRLLSSGALLLAAVVWLVLVELFLRFFATNRKRFPAKCPLAQPVLGLDESAGGRWEGCRREATMNSECSYVAYRGRARSHAMTARLSNGSRYQFSVREKVSIAFRES